jgi:hypothetical protein
LVSRDSFGELLARLTENTVAMTKIATDVFDLMLRNLRLAGRQDITRLARQLGRTEDKIEMLLQEVERLQDRLGVDGYPAPERTSRARRSSSENGADEHVPHDHAPDERSPDEHASDEHAPGEHASHEHPAHERDPASTTGSGGDS